MNAPVIPERRKPLTRRQRVKMHGLRFGKWMVGNLFDRQNGHIRYWCYCDCGNSKPVLGVHLRSGKSTNCGCENTQRLGKTKRTHGRSGTAEYRIWCLMIGRCTNPNLPDYPRYGGRGITVCKRWRESFQAFLDDMGPRPSFGHSIDRYPNQNGNYEPGNCRWATSKQQMRNMSRNRILTIRGERMSLIEAVERFGGNYGTVKWRLRQGQSAEEALRIK